MLDTTDLSFGLRLGLDLALHLDMEQNHAYESETKIGIGKCESQRCARKETQVLESENAFDFSFHNNLFLTGIAACCASSTECSDHVL